jgi:peroxiredoxin
MRGDIEVGARLPDYELPDQDGVLRRLSDLQGSNPMVLHLSRGGFDPKEHRFLHYLVDAYLDFRVGYERATLISTDNQLEINEFRDSLGAQFPFLSDPEQTVRNDLDIVEYTDPVHDPMVPHTFVLAPGLEIRNLQRLLVMGAPDGRRAAPRLARGHAQPAPRLRSGRTGAARGLGSRRARAVPGESCRRRGDSLHRGD